MPVGPFAVACGDGVNVSMTNEELGQLSVMEGRFRVGWVWGGRPGAGGPGPTSLRGTSGQVANALAVLRATGSTSTVLAY